MSEQKFLERLRNGDVSAYRYLFSEYYSWLCNYVFKLSNDYALSEDIVQETMMKLWENRKTITIKTSLKNYIFKSCHNQFLQHVRRTKVQLDSLDDIRWELLMETYVSEEEDTEHKIKKLNSLIDQLPSRCKEIFVKSKFEKRKYQEIAEDLGISVKTVEAQMSRAFRFLREHIHLFLIGF